MAQASSTTTTTRTTKVVTEVPDERRWQGRDWVKSAITGALALALLRPGAQPVAQQLPVPTVAATAVPAVVSTVAPTVAAPAAEAPVIVSTFDVPFAGPRPIQGSAAPGATVEVLINGTPIGTTTAGADGSWSLDTTLEAGQNEIVARTVDAAGAVLATSDPLVLDVQPATPEVAAPEIISSLEAVIAGPRVIRGSGTPGSTIEVLVNGAPVGTTTVGADGAWSFEAVLEEGQNEIVARAVDAAGAVLATSEPLALDAQAAEIAAPTIDAPPGALVGGPALITGTGQPGSTVRVTIGGVDAGEATVGPDGTWELDVILQNGQQEIVAETIDNDGNVIAASDPVTVTVEGGLGVAVSQPAEGAVLEPGPITVGGVGVPGTILEILDGDKVLGEVTVGADGNWSAEVELEAGSSSISVRQKGTDQVLNRPVRVQVGEAAAVGPACTELAVGCNAWVTRRGGLTLRMRSTGAILPDNIIARLPIGTQMEVLEGPTPADGFTWWRVRTVGGNEGWVAGENLVIQPD